ncbi:N-glycosylase/DNA lyase OGG1 isoform X1 [Selaginella moellendorffii]|uniref:N-glycosylase/DNA lyase OGG1 isoform X1 n=1 Tax=Selaginella moellendorffii TaxID=88036 RepID=UPI000D1CC18D|nr:N-glycosylase/DNA lyase OGG1 isoform X1 [Selaginella moellendorffii]XP_024529001.1 N-glycosylase/DNA lyase OGG1 isoform X1 [Selaginella moellendorffii]XP_024529006.1 N-glycosylase/DNA lyase OGG1 isoform X1 [Selaginella moellendorffii]|eukprot:XP_024528999.1 N-glycosylase/DNA lyase OGG1 isoform X1 [Selaginella moellendorffii]
MAPIAKRSLSFAIAVATPERITKKPRAREEWRSLSVPPVELNLALTLLTGQTFLWKQTSPGVFTGALGPHLVSLRQTPQDTLYRLHTEFPGAKEALREFFTLDTSLAALWSSFSAADERFAAVAPYIQGARVLRQDPVECVFQFICSSNNHIQRITKMVDFLATQGSPLGCVDGQSFFQFPSLEQLSFLTEKQLRDAGFGYRFPSFLFFVAKMVASSLFLTLSCRAKYIVGAVETLRSKESGGDEWLKSLREGSLEQATAALCTLPGIGPKVAACVSLFSLDKHDAIPVDTHVWQIAVQYLKPELAGQRLTSKMHSAVAQAFVSRFGAYAGWAHAVLFIAELSSHQKLLPSHLHTQRKPRTSKNSKRNEDVVSL